jgi:hypothetical protein
MTTISLPVLQVIIPKNLTDALFMSKRVVVCIYIYRDMRGGGLNARHVKMRLVALHLPS